MRTTIYSIINNCEGITGRKSENNLLSIRMKRIKCFQ